MVPGIVVRPVHDRRSPRVVHHLAANLDTVAETDGAARRDADVIDDLHSARGALYFERFMHGVRARSIKEARRRGYGSREIHPSRRRAGIRSGQVHATLITPYAAIDKAEGEREST